jgi:hypothetical protein
VAYPAMWLCMDDLDSAQASMSPSGGLSGTAVAAASALRAGQPAVSGNPGDLVGDYCCVCCTQCREAFPARLDGEESVQPYGGEVRAVLAAARWCGCPCCRRLTGLFRLLP